MLKKYLKILLILGLVLSNFAGQIISNEIVANNNIFLSFESSKKNYLEVERAFDNIPKTIETRIKFDQPDNQRKVILGNYVYGQSCFSLEVTATNQLRYVEYVYENGNLVSAIDYKLESTKIFDEKWHDLSIVRNIKSNKILFYLDGALEETFTLTGTGTDILKDNVTLTQKHYIGTDSRKTYFLDADISEIRMWDIEKTAEQINEDLNKELTGNENGLVSCWILDGSDLTQKENYILNKVDSQPLLTSFNFDLPKGRTYLEFESSRENYVELLGSLEKAPKTIDFWARFDKDPNKRQLIFSNYVYGKNGIGVEITADNQLRYVEFAYENGILTGSLDIRTEGQEICTGKWAHYAIVRDIENSSVKIYKDGNELVNQEITNEGTDRLTENLTFTNKHYVGTDFRSGTRYYLEAQLDGLNLWNSSKTAEEINDIMNVEITGKEEDLLHSWDFDYENLSENSNTIMDKKENGINALAINFPKEVKSVLDGKSALFVGDSITNAVKDPDRPYYGWAGRIGVTNNMDWKNAGISSATISTALASSYPENRVVNQLEQGRAYDYVILHGGMNDSIAMTEIGEMCDSYNLEDFDISTFSGAMDELIYTAKQKYPNAIIGYIVNYATPNSTWGGYSSNNKAYFDRAKEICEKWDIPYIDLYEGGIEEDGVYKSYSYDILEVTSGKNMYDGLSTEIHIGSRGYDIISPYIQKWMEEISQYSNEGTDFSNNNIEIEMENPLSEIPLTFETWLKMPQSAANSRGGVIAGNLFDSYYRDIPIVNFEIYNNGVPRLYWTVNNQTYDYKAIGVNVCTDQWVHVAITYDQENEIMTTYINGQKAHEASMNIQLEKLNQPMKIGKDSRDAYNFKGELADLRIWSTTRSQEEIANNFNKDVVDQTGLLGNWKLDKVVDGQYLDSSSNQNHAQNYWIDGDLFAKSADGYESIAVIPDTQTLAMSAPNSFTKLTKWIKNNQKELGIGAVIHVGDIVNERSSHAEWKNARNAMNELNGVVPYVFSAGNHDVEIQKIDGVWYGLRSTPLMNQYFPYSEVASQPTFGGTYKEGEVDNTYSYFTINNVDFMIISLEQSPRLEVLQWANKITEQNKDKKVIVSTHEYLFFDGKLTTRESQDHLDFVGGSTTGEEMWDEYIKKHENITAVIAGHVGYPDLVTSKRIGDNGNEVTQILCDAQFMDRDDVNNGSGEGLGMVMILSFKENSNEIKVNWYSTVREQFYREKNQYTDTMELTNKVSKEDLQTLYDECLKLNETNYTAESWVNFEIAINNAKNILDKASATQDEVDEAKILLQTAKDALVKIVNDSDKTALKIAIDLANETNLDNLIPAVVEEFNAALQQAKEVYADENAMQPEVNAAFDRLAKAMHMLDFKQGDKTALKVFIDKVSGLEAAKYTETTWTAFNDALTTATSVYNDENAMQEEVNNAYKELVTRFLNLRLIPDKSLLEELINQASRLDSANYTKASYAVVENALAAAKVTFENPNASQVEVDNAKDILEKAINSLQVTILAVDNIPNTPIANTANTPVNNGDITSVKTGDNNLAGMFAGLALLSVAGYTVFRRKEN